MKKKIKVQDKGRKAINYIQNGMTFYLPIGQVVTLACINAVAKGKVKAFLKSKK